jgi:thermitase
MTFLKRKKTIFVLLLLGLVFSAFALQRAKDERRTRRESISARRPARELRAVHPSLRQGPRYAERQVLVKFKTGLSEKLIEGTLTAFGARTIKKINALEVYQLQIPTTASVEEMVYALGRNPDVEYAEPNFIAHIATTTPNDPYFRYQYALHNTGQEIGDGGPKGKSNADIKAPEAWGEAQGDGATMIAIVDTGVDLFHPDIQSRIQPPGRDFANDDFDATDDNGHGTHVAGIAAADTDNNVGVAGVAWNCKILPVKVTDENGDSYYSWLIDGIRWAADNGADVINISMGGEDPSTALRDALKYAYDKGIFIAASAGNDDTFVYYPAAYDNYCMAVAATDYDDARMWWSNHGPEIDVAAPGEEVLSLVPTWYPAKVWGGDYPPYGFGDGTSMSAPHVAGLAALIKSYKPWLNPDEIMNIIRYSADDVNSSEHKGKDEYIGYGRINMAKALVPIEIAK